MYRISVIENHPKLCYLLISPIAKFLLVSTGSLCVSCSVSRSYVYPKCRGIAEDCEAKELVVPFSYDGGVVEGPGAAWYSTSLSRAYVLCVIVPHETSDDGSRDCLLLCFQLSSSLMHVPIHVRNRKRQVVWLSMHTGVL